MPTANTKFVIRFILARNNRSEIPPQLLDEAATHGDLVFVNTLDAYLNLAAKVGTLYNISVEFVSVW